VSSGWKPGTHEWWFYKGKGQNRVKILMYEIRAGKGGLKADTLEHRVYFDLRSPGIEHVPSLAFKSIGKPIEPADVYQAIEKLRNTNSDYGLGLSTGKDPAGIRRDLTTMERSTGQLNDALTQVLIKLDSIKTETEGLVARLTPTRERLQSLQRLGVNDLMNATDDLKMVQDEMAQLWPEYRKIDQKLKT
jgi:hypothetical protein